MVERINERKGRGAIQSSAVIESCSDMDRRLVDIWDAEIDLSHIVQAFSILY